MNQSLRLLQAVERRIVQANTPISHCQYCTRQAVLIEDTSAHYVECLWCHARGPRFTGLSAPARALRAWETKAI